MISSFLLVPAVVPGLVSLLVSLLVLSLLKKGVCSIMISSFLLVPALVPGLVCLLVSLLVFLRKESVPVWFFGSSWFLPSCLPSCVFFLCSKKDAVPSCFPASCWFRLWFRGLSSFLVASFFAQKSSLVSSGFPGSSWFRLIVSAHVSLLVSSVLFCGNVVLFPGSGSNSGACLPSAFFLLFSETWSSWFLLVPARVPVLVSLLLSSFFSSGKGVLFHHDVLVPLGSGSGSGACFPSSLFFLFSGMAFCSTMISWFLVVPALVPVLVSLLLSSFFSQEMVFCFLVPARVPVLVSLLLSSFFSQERGSAVPSWFAGCSWFRLRFGWLSPFLSLLSFLRKRGCVPSMISWFLLVPVLVQVLVSLLSFVRKRVLFHFNFLVSPRSGSGSGAYVPSSPFSSFSQETGFVPPRLHGSVATQASCVPFSISSLTNEFRNEQWMKVSNNWNDQWILNCTWPSWKHGLVLLGAYAGVIFYGIQLIWK